MLFDIVNLPYWIFLAIGVLLFLLVIISGGADDDLDVDADADVDVKADGDFSFPQVMGWLGIGKAPLLLLLATDFSLLGLFGWMLNVAIGNFIEYIPSGLFAGIVSLGALFLSMFVGSLIAQPVGKIFSTFGDDASSDRFIGCNGTVSSVAIPIENQGKIGQVDVLDSARNLVTINATLPIWAKVVPARGTQVLAIERQPYSYLVVAKV